MPRDPEPVYSHSAGLLQVGTAVNKLSEVKEGRVHRCWLRLHPQHCQSLFLCVLRAPALPLMSSPSILLTRSSECPLHPTVFLLPILVEALSFREPTFTSPSLKQLVTGRGQTSATQLLCFACVWKKLLLLPRQSKPLPRQTLGVSHCQ